jgi:hypothetical protein
VIAANVMHATTEELLGQCFLWGLLRGYISVSEVEFSRVEKVKRHLKLPPWLRGSPASEDRSQGIYTVVGFVIRQHKVMTQKT